MNLAQQCSCCKQNMLIQVIDPMPIFNVWVCARCDSVEHWPTINGTDIKNNGN